MRFDAYSDERLARLLRLLRAVPESWVANAQLLLRDMIERDRSGELRLRDGDVAMLERKLQGDPAFRERFAADPIAAAEAAGMSEISVALERELRELVALAERIAYDEAYRAELATDPVATLSASGMPATAAEPLLRMLAWSDDLLANVPEVVAHKDEPRQSTSRLLILLLGSTTVTRRIRSIARQS